MKFFFAIPLVIALVMVCVTTIVADSSGNSKKGRLFGSLASAFSSSYFSTVTVSSTSVSTTTCTKSTTACAGRRRREAIIEDLLNKEKYSHLDIDPSFVQKIETTPIPSSRGVRKADPQYYFQQYPYYQRYPYQLDQIYGSIQSGEYYPSPYFGSGYFNPYYGPAIHQQQWDEDESRVPLERFFGLLASNNWRLKTVTSTFFSVSTVTSTPGCSVAGALAQCPASG